MNSNEFEITAPALKERLDQGDNIFLLDVREPFEYEFCRLAGAKLVPLAEVPARLHELDETREIVVYCHAGVRSARAVNWMRQAGFNRVKNLVGGIDAWSLYVDANVPRY